MRTKILNVLITMILLVNVILTAYPVSASSIADMDLVIDEMSRTTGKVVYLKEGEGAAGDGNGTEASPYLNIRTALENVQDGDTLKLIGTVSYAYYNPLPDKSAEPLYINKNITIEGLDATSALSSRTAIQLGADVVFRNFNLQMSLSEEKGKTIFAAGHSLTLDNVTTKLPSELQDDDRPYISGGAYKTCGSLGEKAVITILNPSSESKIAAIYAGGYWNNASMDVQINLDRELLDTTLYTGGWNGSLTGNVEINLCNNSNLKAINRTNHTGNVTVHLMENFFSASLSLENVDELILEKNARINFLGAAVCNVGNVILKENALLDFRNIKTNPIVCGNFIGVSNAADVLKTGAIFLNNEQTLQIGGLVSGVTRMNTYNGQQVDSFKNAHAYICANQSVKNNFTIEGTEYTSYKLLETVSQQGHTYLSVSNGQIFSHMQWSGGVEQIIAPQEESEFAYPVTIYNSINEIYEIDPFDMYDQFEINLVRKDGKILDLEWDVSLYWSNGQTNDNKSKQLNLVLYELDKLYGELVLSVTHIVTGAKIEKTITILAKEGDIPPSNPNPSESDTQLPPINPNPDEPDTQLPPSNSNSDDVEEDEPEEVEVQRIKITAANGMNKIAVGKKVRLTAEVFPENASDKSLEWTVNNKKYATVKNGVVTMKKAGAGKKIVVTAEAADGSDKKAVYKITIMKHAVKSIRLKAAKTVKAGKKLTVKSTVKTTGKNANKSLVFASSNTKYATVSKKGVVKTKKAGKGKTVKITAYATDGTNKKATVKIKLK